VTSDRELHGGVRVNGDEYPLTPPQEACLYHVTKEAVSNVARHANAGSFDVEVTFTPEAVVITVADDGDGFDVDAVTSLDDGTGIGLRTMRERVAARSGVLLVRSSPGAGTEVRAWLPVGDRT
jgi:signal transduction histidine kinase